MFCSTSIIIETLADVAITITITITITICSKLWISFNQRILSPLYIITHDLLPSLISMDQCEMASENSKVLVTANCSLSYTYNFAIPNLHLSVVDSNNAVIARVS